LKSVERATPSSFATRQDETEQAQDQA